MPILTMTINKKDTALQVLLRHFGCAGKEQLMSGYGIDYTVSDIITDAMEAYANQLNCDVCNSNNDVQSYCAECMNYRF